VHLTRTGAGCNGALTEALLSYVPAAVTVAFLVALSPVRAAAQGLPVAAPQDIGLSPTALARIAPALQMYVDSGKLAGVVAVVARHGKIGFVKAIGHMDVERQIPMRPDAVFRIASMTKPVIAVAILKLVEQGRVRLDDAVARYIPAFADIRVYVSGPAANPVTRRAETPITLMHLLTHTSGLTYGYFGQSPVDSIYRRANLFDATQTLEQFADSLARLPLLFSPGEAWVYSMSIDVLGRVVEVASGRPLDRFLSEEVFAPLVMRETVFHVRPEMDGRIPILYSPSPDGRLRADTPFLAGIYLPSARFLSGGGGLLSTPADYLRFAQMLLNGGELEGRRVLTRESVALLMRNHLSASLTPIVSPMVGHSGYGYGLAGAVLIDTARAGVPGSLGIYRWWGYAGTFFWIDPQAKLVGMVWTQFLPGRTYALEQEFQRLVYAALTR
jgi:CubicO group peptidase (beta-lactamase class C family)